MITIRYAMKDDAKAIADIHVMSWQKIYRGLIPDTIFNFISVNKQEQKWCKLIKQGIKVLLIKHDAQRNGFASRCPA